MFKTHIKKKIKKKKKEKVYTKIGLNEKLKKNQNFVKLLTNRNQIYVKLLTNRNSRLLQPHQTRDNEPVSQH